MVLNTPERLGAAYRWRADLTGAFYEYVGLGRYEVRKHLPAGALAVGALPTQVFLRVDPHTFVLVHNCVLVVGCDLCGAKRGARCRHRGMPRSWTHYVRRKAAAKKRLSLSG